MSMPPRVFISCVSQEFHQGFVPGTAWRDSYRTLLARALKDHGILCMVQEEMAGGFGTLLNTLRQQVESSTIVVHLVGRLAGVHPPSEAVDAMLSSVHDLDRLLAMLPQDTATGKSDVYAISYTQWEFYLAHHFKAPLLVFFLDGNSRRGPAFREDMDQALSQEAHRTGIRATGKHTVPLFDQDHLVRRVLRALAQHGLLDRGVVATPEVEERVRHQLPAISEDIRKRSRKRALTDPTARIGSQEHFTAVYNEAAAPYGITGGRLFDLLEAQKQRQDADALTGYESALFLAAMGDHPEALDEAMAAADEALSRYSLEPKAPLREEAIMALELVADEALVMHRPSMAIAARRRAGDLMNKQTERLRWVRYHRTLTGLLMENSQFNEAEQLIREVCEQARSLQSDDQIEAVAAEYDLARILDEQLRFSNALLVLDGVIEVLQRDFPDRVDLLEKAIGVSGGIWHRLGDHDRAEPLLRKALAMTEAQYGPEHPEVSRTLNNLAQLLEAAGRLSEAEPLLARALSIDEVWLDPDHPTLAIRLNNLAILYQSTNRLAKAEPMLRRALNIDEMYYGPEHPRVAVRLNNIALWMVANDRNEDAEALLQRALRIDESAFGPDHPNVAIRLGNLGRLFEKMGRITEAESMMRRSLAIYEKHYAPDHPEVGGALGQLATLLQTTGQLEEAEPLQRRTLAIIEKRLGPEHPKLAVTLNNMAHLLEALGRPQEAEPLLRRSIIIGEMRLGSDHPKVGGRICSLARILLKVDRTNEAVPLIRRALCIFTRSLVEDHSNTVSVRRDFVTLLQDMGWDEDRIAAELVAIRLEAQQDQHDQ